MSQVVAPAQQKLAPTPAAQLRKYQQIWEELKTNKQCTVVAPCIVHARIIKAVSKEKYSDAAFKLCNDHDYFYIAVERVIDTRTPKTGKIIFRLKQRLGLEGIKDTVE